MKKKRINYFKYFSLFFAIAVLVFIAGCTGASPTTGTIEVNSTPTGAKIYLDGVYTGMATPFPITNVEAGSHVIKLDAFHNKIWEETVIVTANDTTYLNPLLTYASTQYTTLQPGPTEGKDALVSSLFPDTNYGNDAIIDAGNTTTAVVRSYIKFNLSSVPGNARVIDADLKLYQSGTYGFDDFVVALYNVTSDWDESTIDWDPQPTSSTEPEITNSITASATTWESWDIDTLVQGWLDGTATNYGMLLKDTDESLFDTVVLFYSSDYTTDTTKCPKLEIDYYIP